MRNIFGCFIFLIITTTSLIFAGTVYYVDATNGDDSKNGQSEGNAWQTIDKVNNSSFIAGDSILFKRGEVWRGTTLLDTCDNLASYISGGGLVPPSNGSAVGGYITFGAYGTGNNPELNGSIDITYDSWTEESIKIWYVDTNDNPDLQYEVLTTIFDDTVEGDEKSSKDDLADKYDWWYDSTNDRLYVYATSDPDGYYSEAEGIIHRWGIRIGGVPWATPREYIKIEDIKVTKFYRRGIRVGYGAASSHLIFEDIEISYTGHDSSAQNFIVGQESNNIEIRRVHSHHNLEQHGIYIDTADNVTIEFCDIHDNNGSGIQFNNNSSSRCNYPIIRYNKLYYNGVCGIQDMAADSGQYYYNLIYGNTDTGIKLNADVNEGGILMNSTDCKVYNNVIYGSGSRSIRIANESAGHLIKNNIAFHTGINEIVRVDSDCSATFANNCYNESSFTNAWAYHGSSYSTLANWSAASGEIISIVQNPLFVDATNGNFALQITSPCIDVGTYVGLTEDYVGNTVPYGWVADIGAYEYTGTSSLNANINASPTSGEVPLTINFTGSATGGTEPYTYSWDFGDSTSSSEQNPSHTYNEAGEYTVTLTVADNDSNQDSDSLIIYTSDPVVISLEASGAAYPTSGEVPLTVNFTGNAAGGVLPYSYSWDFGDSISSSEQNPSHTYSAAGDYTVILTVTDSQSNQDNDSLIINVSVAAIQLEASCAASPTSGEVPLTVNFTGNATGGSESYTYSWDFGDGSSSSGKNPSHPYSQAGDYTVAFTVTDSDSSQDTDSLIINAYDPDAPLVASCAASPTSGEVPLTVNFTGNATGGVLPYSYSWDFGDGTSSSEQNPSHIYSDAGDYTVSLTVTDSQSNQNEDSLIINASAAIPPYLSCSPKSLYFGATTSGNETTDQYLRIINAGSGTLTWSIEDDADWLSFSPSSGIDRGEITVSVNASGLSLGLYVATITVSSPEAYNSPQYVSVNFRIYEPEQENPPFGSLDTPIDGSTVSGSIPIAGWALDDIEVVRLEIKRNSDPVDLPEAIGSDGLVYIGDAVFVEGARPDVEKSYSDYPLNSRAGWGYMLLTNDLPYRGNGSFTIYGFAYDAGGHREEIGRKTILCDNINRIRPFGTIDTPKQGESIRGSEYINFRWALTPLPKTIPKDASTIWVWVDGVQMGEPVYNQYREDIATLYPEYNNVPGAEGYYYLDTTQYENGVHTITWSAMDDGGEVDGIGARYFSVDNIETGNVHVGRLGLKSIYQEDVEGRLRIGIKEVRRGYRLQVDNEWEINKKTMDKILTDEMDAKRGYRLRVDDRRNINTKDILRIKIEEMEPLRIVLEEGSGGNMEYIGWGENKWKDLPIGSTLDRENGIFSWIPTPGFIGRYVFHFAITDGSHRSKPLRVVVNVIPKRDRNKENW